MMLTYLALRILMNSIPRYTSRIYGKSIHYIITYQLGIDPNKFLPGTSRAYKEMNDAGMASLTRNV